MSETQWLKPADGLLVRFEEPAHGHIPADGAELPMTKYYRRRLAAGDLVKARRPAAGAAEKQPAKPAKEG